MNEVKEALAEFFNPENKSSFDEKMDKLREAFMYSSIRKMSRIAKGEKPTDEEVAEQELLLSQFKTLERIYAMQKKATKGKGGKAPTSDFMDAILEMEDSVKDIVRDLRKE